MCDKHILATARTKHARTAAYKKQYESKEMDMSTNTQTQEKQKQQLHNITVIQDLKQQVKKCMTQKSSTTK